MRFFHRGRFTRGRTKWKFGYFWAEHESNVQMKLQPEKTLSIFPYRAEFKDDFFELNAEWLEAYFLIEPYDLEVLRNPQEMILDEGGEIYVGAIDGDVVATFALTPRQEGVMELNKMAVRKDQRGAGIGNQLMDYVPSLGAALAACLGPWTCTPTPSLRMPCTLYRKYGFLGNSAARRLCVRSCQRSHAIGSVSTLAAR